MSVLTWILLASAAGGLLSVAFAMVALAARVEWVPVMVSYAIGALLGAAFLEVLPHAMEHAGNTQALTAVVLGGILLFFLLEKLVLWRHCHVEGCEVHGADALDAEPHGESHGHGHHHGHDHGRSGLMITVGDTFHNFVDGIMIAAAFLVDIKLGVVTTIAIVSHEIPQEMGDFLILLHSGYSRAKALMLNVVSSLATLVGALLGYLALAPMQALMPYILALAAAGMIYVAVADLIPGLHKRAELRHTGQQIVLILLGVATVWLAAEGVEGWLDALGHDLGGHH
ncbi:MAG: ZIP family metal transporter [Thiobacillaceae bacterium]|jgi:zinc and cadmium transporter|nr:ZIP family metal transporter [Thiobacillaceae bacterium]